MKTCTKCKIPKPENCFSKGSCKDGLSSYCKVCDAAAAKKYRTEHPEMREKARLKAVEYRKTARGIANTKRNRLKCRYNITVEEYDHMFEQQGGLCAICGKPETAKHQSGCVAHLAVDHDHKTGNVRGLLCRRCNFIVGYAKDSKEVLLRAALYMEQHNG
jgi:hypothetical protein